MDHRLKQIRQFLDQRGRMPSYAEMAELFGYQSKNAVHYLVHSWKDAGLITADDKGRLLPGAMLHPLRVLGTVEAGFPTPAEEESADTLSLDEWLIGNREASYLLRVSGESMIDAGLRPGDLVILERGRTPKNGDIVVAQLDRDWTMKYYEKRGRQVVLHPANKKFKDIVPAEGMELKIAGVVTGSVRKY
jgi:repressor LexA